MSSARLAIDPLWQCLCPSWSSPSLVQTIKRTTQGRPQALQCLRAPLRPAHRTQQRRAYTSGFDEAVPCTPQAGPITQVAAPSIRLSDSDVREKSHLYGTSRTKLAARWDYGRNTADMDADNEAYEKPERDFLLVPPVDLSSYTIEALYARLNETAIGAKVDLCRDVAEWLIKEKGEKPNAKIYAALILSNASHHLGHAGNAMEYLEEMRKLNIPPDAHVCHAVLKVLSIHPDHLLQSDVLHYMAIRWIQLNEDGQHDVVAGMLREGLFEQAMERLDAMVGEGVQVQSWLYDVAIYMLCDVDEVEEATRLMRQRVDSGEMEISRTVWDRLLDQSSAMRFHPGTAFIWNTQVNMGYMNPPSGTCLNVLSTAASAGDAILATDVFSHLSKRGTVFQPIHYEQLITCYLSIPHAPDIPRAIAILTIMTLEKLDPTTNSTRALYAHLRSQPPLVDAALTHLRSLHAQGRRIPIAALNLLIECYIEQDNVTEAMNIYKLIHTFSPLSQGAKKSFANIETFNFLLRGCRKPPNDQLASFLVSELLALRIRPTALTYDRLIMVFILSAEAIFDKHPLDHFPKSPSPKPNTTPPPEHARAHELLDWSYRHFTDMQPLGFVLRFGTTERLAVNLARAEDARCWEVLQVGAENIDTVEWTVKGKHARTKVEEAWGRAMGRRVGMVDVGEAEGMGVEVG